MVALAVILAVALAVTLVVALAVTLVVALAVTLAVVALLMAWTSLPTRSNAFNLMMLARGTTITQHRLLQR